MPQGKTDRDIDTYLTAYGTPAEMIDRGLGLMHRNPYNQRSSTSQLMVS